MYSVLTMYFTHELGNGNRKGLKSCGLGFNSRYSCVAPGNYLNSELQLHFHKIKFCKD